MKARSRELNVVKRIIASDVHTVAHENRRQVKRKHDRYKLTRRKWPTRLGTRGFGLNRLGATAGSTGQRKKKFQLKSWVPRMLTNTKNPGKVCNEVFEQYENDGDNVLAKTVTGNERETKR